MWRIEKSVEQQGKHVGNLSVVGKSGCLAGVYFEQEIRYKNLYKSHYFKTNYF